MLGLFDMARILAFNQNGICFLLPFYSPHFQVWVLLTPVFLAPACFLNMFVVMMWGCSECSLNKITVCCCLLHSDRRWTIRLVHRVSMTHLPWQHTCKSIHILLTTDEMECNFLHEFVTLSWAKSHNLCWQQCTFTHSKSFIQKWRVAKQPCLLPHSLWIINNTYQSARIINFAGFVQTLRPNTLNSFIGKVSDHGEHYATCHVFPEYPAASCCWLG